MKNEKITSRDVDFAKWYTDVVNAAHLSSYSNVKGCIILEPNGYAIWERIQQEMNKMFKKTGHKNVAMPMLIPEGLMRKEGELVNGFAPEVAWVTEGGSKKLEERLCIRPTSETLFSDYYASVVKSYRDLPLKYNQWCSVLRWEKETRPFLRSREFWWQEGHTVHATREEAEKETRDMLNVYKTFFEKILAIPAITGRKTEKEKFAGADYTLTIEALMHNGIALQSGTSHYFGQRFSRAYDIKFLNKSNELEYAYQTSWGTSSRMIGALIMVHSDDNGLVCSLYTSILPCLLSKEIINKLDKSSAPIVYACNLFTQPGETDKFKVSDHLKIINSYLGKRKIDVVIANNGKIDERLAYKYLSTEQKDPVLIDYDETKKNVKKIIEDNLITIENGVFRHDTLKLGYLLFSEVLRLKKNKRKKKY